METANNGLYWYTEIPHDGCSKSGIPHRLGERVGLRSGQPTGVRCRRNIDLVVGEVIWQVIGKVVGKVIGKGRREGHS